MFDTLLSHWTGLTGFQQVGVAFTCWANLTVETKDLKKKIEIKIVLFILFWINEKNMRHAG